MHNKSYRVKANVSQDEFVSLNVNLTNDFDILEILSLKIGKENIYKMHTAKYGCIVGRVLANGNFGVPNAKVSVFISVNKDDLMDPILGDLYPYTSTFSKNKDGVRYNLLPSEKINNCHQNVGTFPSKRMLLDDDNMLEVFDTYYKYTTVTNNSGDYMIFGVPTGNQTVHVDIDLSDIGLLSQKPRDMLYKGSTMSQFENANQFKTSKNLDTLTQIISQNETVFVYPFWGDESEGEIKITRSDVAVNYKFEPTCVFIGSLVADNTSNAISKKCIPHEKMGKMEHLTTGEGVIEMIRKTPNGKVEEIQVMGNQLIDGNGTWCYQIPMNLDYMRTDEYGNLVPTDNPEMGIPTRARMRFRLSLNDFGNEASDTHLTKVLVPNNPQTEDDLDYVFGTETMDKEDGTGSFRDLFWNNVYTVKSYIPRIQKSNRNRDDRFTGIKNINVNNGNNPIPYNNMRVNITFMFTLQCAIMKMLVKIATLYNNVLTLLMKPKKKLGWWEYALALTGIGAIYTVGRLTINGISDKAKKVVKDIPCMMVGDGACPDLDGWFFAPGCGSDSNFAKTLVAIQEEEDKAKNTNKATGSFMSIDSDDKYCLTNDISYFMNCIEIALAMENNVIQFDFYNDWVNGMVYAPRWFGNIRKKRTYLFGLIKRKEKVQACMEDNFNLSRRLVQQCALDYTLSGTNLGMVTTPKGCKNDKKLRCHKSKGRKYVKIFKGTRKGGGIVHDYSNMNAKSIYYLRPAEWLTNGKKVNLFATDIVLLGTVRDCDYNGIPQAFKDLSSSSYQMPPNIAATNMDVVGYMYGINGTMSLCNKTKVTFETGPIRIVEDTFENYKMWSKEDVVDNSEYPVTEMSGIDWGYTGPGQEIKNLTGKNENNIYTPGGHFLGISCTNSDVSIKSCVNLSRICEVGSEMSQRRSIFRKKNNNGEVFVDYIVPNGLISKDEISDSSFRYAFSTLNHNGLKTGLNANGMRYYEFSSYVPTNFGGEMTKYSPLYKQTTSSDAWEDGHKEYIRSLESNSKDYTLFRLGVEDVRDVPNKYLITSGGKGSMPMYENSYYFYFGLKDGNTAFDRFYSDYYAICPETNEYTSDITLSTTDREFCDVSGGSVEVSARDYEPPYTVQVTDSNGGVVSGYDNKKIDDENFVITGLTDGTYHLNIINNDGIEYNNNFTIGVKEPNGIENVSLSYRDYTFELLFDVRKDGKDNKDTCYILYNTLDGEISDDTTELNYSLYGGYVEVLNYTAIQNLVDIVVYNESYYYSKENKNYPDLGKKIEKFHGVDFNSDIAGSEHSYFCYLWEGNVNFKIMFYINCNGNILPYEFATLSLSMHGELDYYIGDTFVTGKYLKSKGLDATTENWYADIFSSDNGMDEVHLWALRKGLVFQNSIYNRDMGSIKFGLVNAQEPSYVDVYGCGEGSDIAYRNDAGTILTQEFISGLTSANTSAYSEYYEFDRTYVSKEKMNQEDAYELGYNVSIDSLLIPTKFLINSGGTTDKLYKKLLNDENNPDVNDSYYRSLLINYEDRTARKSDYEVTYYDSANIYLNNNNNTNNSGSDSGNGNEGEETNPDIYTITYVLDPKSLGVSIVGATNGELVITGYTNSTLVSKHIVEVEPIHGTTVDDYNLTVVSDNKNVTPKKAANINGDRWMVSVTPSNVTCKITIKALRKKVL